MLSLKIVKNPLRVNTLYFRRLTKSSKLHEWDPDDFPVDDLIRGCMLLLEIGIMQPKLQILWGTAGLTMKHMKQFSPAIAIQAIHVMGYIPPECLLKRYGGHRQSVSRLTKIKQYNNKDFDNDMRTLGYAVD